jgi:hypothetical protein
MMKNAKRFAAVLLSTAMTLSSATSLVAANETQLENVALNKPVSADAGSPSRAVDGDITNYWDGGVASEESPSELTIDLEGYYEVSSINVIPYYGGTRYYHYSVLVSSDGYNWTTVGEKTSDTKQTSKGETYDLTNCENKGIRYVTISMTYNSANPSVHINEVFVYGKENTDFEAPAAPTTDPYDADNIAFGKPTRSNTNDTFSSRVVDGLQKTSWTGEDYPKYVDIDLLDNYDLSGVKVYMPTKNLFAYNVYVSTDGSHFTKVYETDGEVQATTDGDYIPLDNVTARVIRVLCTGNSQGEGASSAIAEVKAYGTLSDTPVTETRTSLDIQDYESWLYDNYGVDVDAIKDEDGNYDMADTYTEADTIAAVDGVITRLLGEKYIDWFEFVLAPNPDGSDYDYYTIDMNNGKVRITGNEGLSLTSGLNHYLKYYCNVSITQQTSQTNMPDSIVPVESKISKSSPYEVRYAYNYCTLSYTMPFWGYDEWQREMDYFALNGVNLILDTTATEAVYTEYLTQWGYSLDDAIDYVCGYSYKAWWLMGNLSSYGGPVSDEWIIDSVEMARTNQRFMTVMGMQPCLQGFMGAMPEDFGTKSAAVLTSEGYDDPADYMVEQGDWSGFTRPPILKTTYDGWETLADSFYEAQEKIYGQVTNYYAGDLAHEGGVIPPDLSKPEMSRTILDKMIDYDEDAVWVIQSWLSNPNKEILEGFGEYKEDHALVLDLDATANPHWSNTTNWNGKEFGGTSWVFCMLDNYGGRTGLHGELEYLANAITYANANSSHMKGIGITPEGTLLNPVNYDLFWEMAWETEAMDLDSWLESYIERRYGTIDDNLRQAWDILLDTAYSYNKADGTYKYHTGNNNAITNMRPSLSPEIVIGSYDIAYDASEFEKVMDLLMEDYDELKDNECYIYDLVDVLRQTVANTEVEYFNRILEAYDAGNLEIFEKYKNKMLRSIELIDEIASYQEDSLYGTWISKATNWADDTRNATYSEETGSAYDDFSRDMMVYNAKAICSIWSSKTLQTYGHRQYSGMEKDYNYEMWSLWLDRIETAINGGGYTAPTSSQELFNIGWNMVINGDLYTTEVTPVDGDPDDDDVRSLKEVYEEVKSGFLRAEALKDTIVDENIADEATPYAESSLGSYNASKLNDGDESSLWIANGTSVPVYAGLTFDSDKSVYQISLVFETRSTLGANQMDIVVEAKSSTGEYKTIYEGKSFNEETQKYRIDIPVDTSDLIQDIRVTFNSNGGIYPAIEEIKVYSSAGISLLDTSSIYYEDGILGGVPDGYTVKNVVDVLSGGNNEFVLTNGDLTDGVLGDDDLVSEGTKVLLVSGTNVIDSAIISMASSLKGKLEALVEEAEDKEESVYTSASYAALQTRLAKVKATLESASSTPTDYKKAIDQLQESIDSLVDIQSLKDIYAELVEADTDYAKASNVSIYEDNMAAAKDIIDDLDNATAEDIYNAYGYLELAANALLPEDSSNIAPKGTAHVDSQLSSYYGATKINNGKYTDCWVAASRTSFPVSGGVTLKEPAYVSSVKAVFEENGDRNTQLGFYVSVQTEDGVWHTIGTGKTGSNTGYTFEYEIPEELQDQKIADVKVTITTYATDSGSPYPGVAELEIYEAVNQPDVETALTLLDAYQDEDYKALSSYQTMAAAAKKLQYASLNSTVSQNFIDDAQAQYDSAAAAINTELLQAYVNVAADLNEDIYTTKALRKINKLAENAKTLLADEDSTDEQKLAAASALKEALADTTALDTSVLSVVINEADKINLDDYADLDDTKANFTAALEAAKSTVETAEKKAEVEAAAIALNEAMMELRVKPSAETLEELKAILAQLKETDASNTDENTQAEKEDLVNEIEEAIDSPATYQLQAVRLLSRARTTIESINSYEPAEVIEDITPNELPSITDEKITIDLPEENAVSAGVENVVDSLAQAEKDVAEKVNANKEADVTSETEPIVSIDDASKVAESITAPESTDKAVNAPETETSVTADTDKAAATSTSVKTGVAAAPYLVAAGASLVALLKKRKKH